MPTINEGESSYSPNPSARCLPATENSMANNTPRNKPLTSTVPNHVQPEYVPALIPIPILLEANSNSMCGDKVMDVVSEDISSTADHYRVGADDDSDEGNEESRYILDCFS